MQSAKTKAALQVAACFAVSFTAYEVVRGYLHLRAAHELITKASLFPTELSIGSGPVLNYVSLGDSTAQGVGADRFDRTLPYQIAEKLHGRTVRLSNLAQSGATIADVVDDQIPKIPDGKVDLITISISANDVTHNTNPEALQTQLDALFKKLEVLGPASIVIGSTPNFQETPALPWLVRRVFYARAGVLAQKIEACAHDHPNVAIADLFEHGSILNSEYAKDGFHPSPKGYARWAKLYYQAARVKLESN